MKKSGKLRMDFASVRIIIWVSFLTWLNLAMFSPTFIYADDDNAVINQYAQELLETEEYQNLENITKEMFGEQKFSLGDYLNRIMNGKEVISIENVKKLFSEGVIQQWKREKNDVVRLLGMILFAAVFSGVAKAMDGGQVAESGYFVTYLMLFSVLAMNYFAACEIVKGALEQLLSFMEVLIPVYTATTAFAVGTLTAKSVSAVLLMSLAIVDSVLLKIVFPCISAYMLLVLINHINPDEPFQKMTGLASKGIHTGLKLILMAVIGINALQTRLTPGLDAVGRKTILKVSELIPGLGDFLSGAAETVFSAGGVIKNAIGMVGIVVLLMLCMIPAAKLLLSSFLYRAVAAVTEPISDKRLLKALSETAEGFGMLLKVLVTGVAIFLVTLAILLLN